MLQAIVNERVFSPVQVTEVGRCPTSAEIEAAHEDLLRSLAEMARATQPDTIDLHGYTAARWRLSKANRRRRDLWEKAYNRLRGVVSGKDADVLKRLADANVELRSAFAAHISKWSTEAVAADWESYCQASRMIRWSIMSLVRHERRDLLPMLKRPAASRS